MTSISAAPVDLATSGDSTRPRSRLAKLLWHQVRFDLLALSRNPQARFFTMAMPVGFLVLFCAIFGNGVLHVSGHVVNASTYYVASLTTFAIVDVAFMAQTIALVDQRESGVLRRRQATPQPSWVIVTSRAVTSVLSASATAMVLLVIGRLAYGASTPIASIAPLVVSVALGSVVFCCLGFAITGFVGALQSAQPVVMAATMPLFFISGIFVPWPFIPHWLQHLSAVFPIRHLALAILGPIGGSGPAWSGMDLLILAAWGVGGLALALRSFKWAAQDV